MREYDTGARRDSREGKGRYDLISPYALERLARRLEFGVNRYGERNWEKGQHMMDYFDSQQRHMNKWLMGMRDEDHLAAAFWNIMCMMHDDTRGTADYAGSPSWWGDSEGVITDHLPHIDSKGSVSPSKTLEVSPKVIPHLEAKDPLGAVTERQWMTDDEFLAKLGNRACTYCFGGLDECPQCAQEDELDTETHLDGKIKPVGNPPGMDGIIAEIKKWIDEKSTDVISGEKSAQQTTISSYHD